MVTLVPGRRRETRPEIRDLVARCLEVGDGAPAPTLLREQADRLLTVLAEAGLVLEPRRGGRLPA
jgi:hypothetical protein